MATLEDLIVLERRGELSLRETRRLRAAEVALPAVAHGVRIAQLLDEEGRAQAGDAQAHEKLWQAVARQRAVHLVQERPASAPKHQVSGREVASSTRGAPDMRRSGIRYRRRSGKRSLGVLAAGALLTAAAAAAAAYGGYQWVAKPLLEHFRQPSQISPGDSLARSSRPSRVKPTAVVTPRPNWPVLAETPRLQPVLVLQPKTRPVVAPPVVAPKKTLVPTPKVAAVPPVRSVPVIVPPKRVRRRPVSLKTVPSKSSPLKSIPSESIVQKSFALAVGAEAESKPAPVRPVLSAKRQIVSKPTPVIVTMSSGQMLRRAQIARRRSWKEATSVYRDLLSQYPHSGEAGVAEMALAKRASATGNYYDARRWYRRHQRRHSSALRAEAHWGEVTTSRKLHDAQALRHALRAMVRIFPSTPYGQVAREELRALESSNPLAMP